MSNNKKQSSGNPAAVKGANITKTTPQSTAPQQKSENNTFTFGSMNYILLGIGILLLGIGYLLLSGGGSDDPNVFNDAMFNNRRLVVAPLVIVAGLVVEICAIMFRPKNKDNGEEPQA